MAGEPTGADWLPEPSDTAGIKADFYSDMKTRPTEGMLQALVRARVGDEQKGEDPTTNELCNRVAALTGKYVGRLRIPVTIVPGNLSEEDIDAVS